MKESLETINSKVGDITGSSTSECFALYKAIMMISKSLNGEILEIGCLYGKTSIAMLLAAQELGEQVVCVDHFFQYPDLNKCSVINEPQYPSRENIEDAFSKNTYLEFTRNLIKLNLYENALIIASKSINLSKIWGNPIKFIFIDADHSYAGVKQDFELFESFVVPGGLIAMHDIDQIGHPDIYRYFIEIMNSDRYEIFCYVQDRNCMIIRKKGGVSVKT